VKDCLQSNNSGTGGLQLGERRGELIFSGNAMVPFRPVFHERNTAALVGVCHQAVRLAGFPRNTGERFKKSREVMAASLAD
jgi:hypothetical protein